MRERAQEFGFVNGEGFGTTERTVNDGMTDVGGGHVEGAEFFLEFFAIIDHRREIGERNELAVVQTRTDEAGVTVAALLAVGHDIDVGAQLGFDGETNRVVGGGLKFGFGEAAFEMFVDGLMSDLRQLTS